MWELVHKVKYLSLGGSSHDGYHRDFDEDEVQEHAFPSEEQLLSFELPATCFSGSIEAAQELMDSIARRTLVTAARGSGLRRLALDRIHEKMLWKCFAIPSLLPCWVGINEWATYSRSKPVPWLGAAIALRPALAHTTQALDAAQSGLRGADGVRLLEVAEVQAMHSHLERMPVVCKPDWNDKGPVWGPELEPATPFAHYLAWLRDDAELARQVAEVWNAIVERGEADMVRCYCSKCVPKSEAA